MGKKKAQKVRARSFFKGFKDFVTKGNVVDLAVGIIIGAAFGKIITSLVNDIIMPPIGLLIGGVDFKDLVITLKAASLDGNGEIIQQAIQIRYGLFITSIIEFLIIALAIYAVLTLIIRRKDFLAKVEAELNPVEPEPIEEVIPEDILLLREIRDELKREKSK